MMAAHAGRSPDQRTPPAGPNRDDTGSTRAVSRQKSEHRRQLRADRHANAPEDDRSLRDELVADAASMSLALSDSTIDALMCFVSLLAKWNAVYNLTAVRTRAAMITQHLADSLSIMPALRERLAGVPSPHVVDVGSGGGLPGIPLAIAWPSARFTLVEPVGKKVAFLRQCVQELRLDNVDVVQAHLERMPARRADAIVCRAFASLGTYAQAIDAWCASSGATRPKLVAAMKAAVADDESQTLPAGWRIAEVLPLDVPRLDARRHLVLLERQA